MSKNRNQGIISKTIQKGMVHCIMCSIVYTSFPLANISQSKTDKLYGKWNLHSTATYRTVVFNDSAELFHVHELTMSRLDSSRQNSSWRDAVIQARQTQARNITWCTSVCLYSRCTTGYLSSTGPRLSALQGNSAGDDLRAKNNNINHHDCTWLQAVNQNKHIVIQKILCSTFCVVYTCPD